MFQASILGLAASGSVACTLHVTRNGIGVQSEGHASISLLYPSIDVSAGGFSTGGDTNGQLIFKATTTDGRSVTIYCGDKTILKHFEKHGAPMQFQQKLKEANWERPIGSSKRLYLTLAILFAWALVVFGALVLSGELSYLIAAEVSPETETKLGRDAARQVLSKKNVCANPVLNQAVQIIGERLVKASGIERYKFHFKVTDDGSVNAYALPGGYVFVNLGLIRKAENVSEVAGVLAHEVQHALQRHGLRNVINHAGLSIIAALVVGMTDVGFIAGSLANLGSLSFDWVQETKADLKGLDLLFKARFDPNGLPKFFERLQTMEKERGGSNLSILSTHPSSKDRADTLRKLIAEHEKVQPLPFPLKWKTVRESKCQSVSFGEPDRLPPGADPKKSGTHNRGHEKHGQPVN